MRFCQRHWDALKKAIEDRGLMQYVAKSGEEIVAKTVSELEKGGTAANFDPLMTAHNCIISQSLRVGMFEIFQQNEDGTDRCPICFFQQICKCGKPDCKERFEAWIQHAATDTVAIAEARGLVHKT